MDFDTHINFAQGQLAAVPVDTVNGTELSVYPGQGSRFAANMPVTLHPPDVAPTYDNAEIGYVTAINLDAMTVLRGQEGSLAKSVGLDWVITGTITAKTLQDIEAASDKSFSQSFSGVNTVVCEHNFGKRPAVSVIDSAGDEVEGDVQHLSYNVLVVSFNYPHSGVVFLN